MSTPSVLPLLVFLQAIAENADRGFLQRRLEWVPRAIARRPVKVLACQGEGEDTHARVAAGKPRGVAHGFQAGDGGGTSGQDIVDEKNVFAHDFFRTGHDEGATDVLHPRFGRKERLGRRVNAANHGRGADGQSRHLRHAIGDFRTLVVAALVFLALVERHGHDEVNAVEETVVVHRTAHRAAQKMANSDHASVFQRMDHLSDIASRRIFQPRCRTLHGRHAPEEALNHVVWLAEDASLLDVRQAGRTENFFVAAQNSATHEASPWRKQHLEISPALEQTDNETHGGLVIVAIIGNVGAAIRCGCRRRRGKSPSACGWLPLPAS